MPSLSLSVFLGLSILSGPGDGKDAQIESLISELTNVRSSVTEFDPETYAPLFIAVDEVFQFKGTILEPVKPKFNPTMRKLVRLGITALPKLLHHLDDPRRSQYTFKQAGGFGAMWFADRYDSRSRDPKKAPPYVNQLERPWTEDILERKYTFTVGDLCYIAIGQIVNRDLEVLSSLPMNSKAVSSPTRTPELARATRADWAGLTPEAHRLQLTKDAYALFDSDEALKRLLFYYPSSGESLALRMLQRPFYDPQAVDGFVATRLMKATRPERWEALYQEAVGKFGPNVASVLPSWVARRTTSDYDPAERVRARAIWRALFPRYSVYENFFCNAVDPRSQMKLVLTLAPHKSQKLDRAIHTMFAKALSWSKSPQINKDDKIQNDIDKLAFACIQRMKSDGDKRLYATFLNGCIREGRKLMKGLPKEYEQELLKPYINAVRALGSRVR